MNVSVDPGKCQGHARCSLVCPEVFDTDEDGHAVVIAAHITTELEPAVRDAVANCPELAISIT